jgi:NADH dehydrogenase FAD-containing subunit
MVEKNSHLNYLFAFPRFAVIPGHERQAFIPYDGLARAAPAGAFSYVQDTVTHISAEHVYLSSGDPLEYAYLAIATGSAQALPSKVSATEREEACEELRSVQEKIQAAQRIAVVGGGAVGVEIASDIKSFFPGKDVTLVHSRPQLLSHFGTRLHEHASAELTKMGVRLVLQERPEILPGQISLRFADDRIEEFDLVVSFITLCCLSKSAREVRLTKYRSLARARTPAPGF